MNMVWNSGMGTPMPTAPREPGREYTPSSQSRTFSPSNNSSSDVDRWDEYVRSIQEAMQASAGWQREQFRMQLEDAQRGRENAMAIARLSAENARYGVDVGRQNMLDQLRQTQQQFEANHALEQQRFGLSVAEAYTDYAKTPDMRWSANDFDTAIQNVGLGGGPVPIAGQARPQPKSWQDFAALSGFNTPVVQAGQTQPPAGGAGGPDTGRGAVGSGGAGTPTDPRLTAATGILKALPPSGTAGHDQNDWAALEAVRNLYLSGRPGEVERLGRPRQRIAEAGLARLGYDPALVVEERRRGLPGQGSVRMA